MGRNESKWYHVVFRMQDHTKDISEGFLIDPKVCCDGKDDETDD